jgi:ribonuclease R
VFYLDCVNTTAQKMLRRFLHRPKCPRDEWCWALLSGYNWRILRHETAPTEDDILNLLSRLHGTVSPREMAEALGKRHSARRALPKILRQLKKRGLVEEVRRDRFRLAQTKAGGTEGQRKGRAADRPFFSASPREEAPRLSASDPQMFAGRLVAHRDGYGFVVPEKPRADLDGDLFIPPDQMHDAMHGDRVAARIERRDRSRDGRSRAEGRIVRVLDRAHPTIVGLFRYGSSGNFVLPYETRLTQEIVIPAGEELPPELRAKVGGAAARPGRSGQRLRELDGAVVQVELTRFPRGGVAPAGRVVEVLGRPGDLGVDIEIMIRKHHLLYKFSEAVLDQARAVAQPVSDADHAGRRDFRDLPIVTIDGETARDFDDAVYAERRNGGWRLQVHIADVAHYVAPGSALDGEARLRGNSVYFPDRAVPMLPEELSNGICSLKPHEDRLVMSALLELDSAGEVTSAEFVSGVIRSAERMTYTNVNRVLEGDREMLERYAALTGHFRDMRDLALLLNQRRAQRGSIDFDLPEPVLVFDEKGAMTSIVRSERNIAHRLIEEFMLAANRAVARFLEESGLTSLHRVHEKPDPKKVLEFEELAQAFGYSLGVPGLSERRVQVRHGRVAPTRRHGRGPEVRERPMYVTLPGAHEFAIRPQHYQHLAQKIAGKPEERIVSYLMLRSLKQARYTADPLGHFALAFDHYTHFTSPIRRYPDLIIHRLLKYALAHRSQPVGNVDEDRGERTEEITRAYPRGELDSIALETSEAERRADAAERELVDWKRAQYMEQHLGEEYDALIISVQKFGFFVELMEVFVEGLVPLQRLEEDAGDRCLYRERDHAIVCGRGPRARIWRLGDRLRVRADRIDPMRRRVEFSLADGE